MTAPAHPLPNSVALAGIVIVDAFGHVLLQERDSEAPTFPDQWALVGGHVEPGESFLEGAGRELAEETGLAGIELECLWAGQTTDFGKLEDWRLFIAFSEHLVDGDIVVGEGRQIRFVSPDELDHLPVVPKARQMVDKVLLSDQYTRWMAEHGL